MACGSAAWQPEKSKRRAVDPGPFGGSASETRTRVEALQAQSLHLLRVGFLPLLEQSVRSDLMLGQCRQCKTLHFPVRQYELVNDGGQLSVRDGRLLLFFERRHHAERLHQVPTARPFVVETLGHEVRPKVLCEKTAIGYLNACRTRHLVVGKLIAAEGQGHARLLVLDRPVKRERPMLKAIFDARMGWDVATGWLGVARNLYLFA